MEQDEIVDEGASSGISAGEMLRTAREKKGLEIEQVAAETRIPRRHLEAIEAGDFAALPSRTYAVGFSRTYARLLDLDERTVLDQVRSELAAGLEDAKTAPAKFEPGDPARVPGRGLAWFAVFAALLLMGGIYAFYRSYFAPGLGPAPLRDPAAPTAATDAPAPPQPSPDAVSPQGPVVFTSEMDGTWVKFYDAQGERLYEAQMAAGDSYTIPADAEGPQVWTGRPYALSITIGGKSVPKLADEDVVVRDVPVSAEALLARSSQTDAAPPADSAPTTTPAT